MDSLSGPIIDAHVHVWTPDVKTYPLASGYRKQDLNPPSFTPEELFVHCRAAGVERINLIQMSFYGDDHAYLLQAAAKYPENFSATGQLIEIPDDTKQRADQTMLELASKGVRAFRLFGGSYGSPLGARWMDHPNYETLYRTAAEHNLALSFLVNPSDLAELNRLSERFPRTPVIIDHLARIGADGPVSGEDVDTLCRLARHKKIMLKVGAFYALGEKKAPYLDLLPMIRQVVGAFGPERCMWESDCPFQVQPPHTYDASLTLIRDHADFLTASDKEHILVKTAEKFFFQR